MKSFSVAIERIISCESFWDEGPDVGRHFLKFFGLSSSLERGAQGERDIPRATTGDPDAGEKGSGRRVSVAPRRHGVVELSVTIKTVTGGTDSQVAPADTPRSASPSLNSPLPSHSRGLDSVQQPLAEVI